MRISDWSSDVCSSDLTRDRKRAEFQPVPAAAFMRFLFDWQGLVGSDKREGPAALELVLAQLEGFPVAASAWESEILPVRTHWYEAHWLDQLCASGPVIWQRPPAGRSEESREGTECGSRCRSRGGA